MHTREKLVALGTVGKDGARLFSLDDVIALSKKSSAPITRIATVVQRLSGMDRKSEEKLRKNLKSQGGNLPSG